MTTTTQAHGGGAQPASIDTSGKVAGGAALRVYGFDSEADAQAAGYVCEGGPAMSVALITDAQIAAGEWKAEGDPAALAVYTAPSNMPVEGGYAVPVYPVNGWGSAPAPVAPQFSSSEIGTVNASTVAVTFDQDISASDYSAGVTIKVNGSGATINSATRQSNHAIVYYALSAAVVFGDVVTWEYSEASGNIIAEDDSTPLEDVSAQSVTNNVTDTIGNGLRANVIAYYRFANDVLDSTNNHLDFIEINPVTFAEGWSIFGAGDLFSNVVASNVPQLNFGDVDFTVVYEFKRSRVTDGITVLASSTGPNPFEIDVQSIPEFPSVFFEKQSDGNSADAGTYPDPMALNQMHLAIAWYTSSNQTIHISIDNLSDHTATFNPPETITPETMQLIVSGSNDFYFRRLGIWGRVLSSDERAYLWNNGAGRALFPAP